MTIFVSVASYCDDLLLQTLEDCYRKASHPESLFFGVVDQDETGIRAQIDALSYRAQIRYLHIHPLDSRGVSWARYLAYSLYDGEDHFLQIDAHMQFDAGWDESLLHQLDEVGRRCTKPILTIYPHPFEMEDGLPSLKPVGRGKVMYLRPKPGQEITLQSPAPRFQARFLPGSEPVRGGHIAAGFLFTKGAFVEEIPYDPYLYFTGEEHSLAARAYTHGWDIFHPVRVPIYHLYKKAGDAHRGQHWNPEHDAQRVVKRHELQQRGVARLRQLLLDEQMNGVYGLGCERPLDGLSELSGVDYRNRCADPDKPPHVCDGLGGPLPEHEDLAGELKNSS